MDVTKLLAGTVDEVKTSLAGLSNDDLQKLRTAEEAGKNRSTVLAAVDEALAASGETTSDIDSTVDHEPRANTTALQNRIDFNDPTISGAEAVERSLNDQAKA